MMAKRAAGTAGERVQEDQRSILAEGAKRYPGVAEVMALYERTASQRVVTKAIRKASLSDRTNA